MEKDRLIGLTLALSLAGCSSGPVTEADLAGHTFRLTPDMKPTTKSDNPEVDKLNRMAESFGENVPPVYQFEAGDKGQGTNVPDIGMLLPLVGQRRHAHGGSIPKRPAC